MPLFPKPYADLVQRLDHLAPVDRAEARRQMLVVAVQGFDGQRARPFSKPSAN